MLLPQKVISLAKSSSQSLPSKKQFYAINETFLLNCPWTDKILHECYFHLSFNARSDK